MKFLGYIFQFLDFVYNLFHKDSDDHLKDAYKQVEKQDETIAGLEEENNAKDMEAGLKQAETEIRQGNLAERIKNYYKNRGKK